MAQNIFSNITQRGTKALFDEAMAAAPNVWQKHCQVIPSDAPDEAHVWLGTMPVPREMVSGRTYAGMRDFTFTVTNKEYEMSLIVDQTTLEDDRHGLVLGKIRDALGVWAQFKDSLFGTLLINGETDTLAFDGLAFHAGTRVIGSSANIDNQLTANITTPNVPTIAEMTTAIKECKESMWRFQDDQGRVGYSTQAMRNVRVICAPEQEKVLFELVNANLLTVVAGDGASSNVFVPAVINGIDVLPYLTDADDAIYFDAVGNPTRMPFIYQERTEPQIEVLNEPGQVAEAHGVKILTRQRFRFAYGEPRYSIRYDFT